MDADRPLAGKVALITGAGRGFGAAIAERFAAAGADLALNYRASKEASEALAARVREAGQRAIAVQADIADGPAVEAMIARVRAELGDIDILVNNAGVMHLAPFVETAEEAWRAEMEVNLFGTMRVTRAVLPQMIARRSGKIVNLSSQLALTGWDRAAVYAGSKGFILTWSKSLAREVGRYNINVNVIGPGSIITDMNRDVYPTPEAAERRAAELPLRRLGSPRDVAECALFLATDAGSFLTGQMLGPNGGNVM
jgi:NAD(P)-dependent dehydrogenase (short-subunit alcohol dehydrogenase family)